MIHKTDLKLCTVYCPFTPHARQCVTAHCIHSESTLQELFEGIINEFDWSSVYCMFFELHDLSEGKKMLLLKNGWLTLWEQNHVI